MANMTTLLEDEFLKYFLTNTSPATTPATSVDVLLCDDATGTFAIDTTAPATNFVEVGQDTGGDGIIFVVTSGVARYGTDITITMTVASSGGLTGFVIVPAGSAASAAWFAADLGDIVVAIGDSIRFAATTGLTISAL